MAIENKNIVADMIGTPEFPDLADEYEVFSVPDVIINEKVRFQGAYPEDRFALEVLKAVE